jgi:sugar phosphate isomerase/epimerase
VEKWPLGVFASIDAGLGVRLEVASELGVPTVHLHAPQRQSRTAEKAEEFLSVLGRLGITITAVFAGFEGESYADIPTVCRTVGLVPPSTRRERALEFREIADFARLLDVPVVALHLGFISHDATSADYGQVVEVTRQVCDHCRSNGQSLHLETGQESADALLEFLRHVDRDNLWVNFDPANMILYGSGEPIEALEKIGAYVRSVHCKDARWAKRPRVEWGQEVPLGEGEVGMERYLRTLDRLGYTGPLTIEREIPQEPTRQKEEIGRAVRLLTELKAAVG